MARQFVYFYLMREGAPELREAVPEHIAHWKNARLAGYRGGPFVDRSGGLITFAAADLAEATAIIDRDPFVLHGVLRDRWIKEWVPE